MKEAFGDSWVVFGNFLETMLTVIIYLLPFIIMLAVIVIIILALIGLFIKLVVLKHGFWTPGI